MYVTRSACHNIDRFAHTFDTLTRTMNIVSSCFCERVVKKKKEKKKKGRKRRRRSYCISILILILIMILIKNKCFVALYRRWASTVTTIRTTDRNKHKNQYNKEDSTMHIRLHTTLRVKQKGGGEQKQKTQLIQLLFIESGSTQFSIRSELYHFFFWTGRENRLPCGVHAMFD